MSPIATRVVDLKAISERYFAAWADRDPDAIVALHTDDTQFWTHLGGAPVVGRDAVRATFAELFIGFPDFSFETYRVLYGEDHWVLDWALISGDTRFRLPRRRRGVARRPRRPQGHLRRRCADAGRDGNGDAVTTVAKPADQLPLCDRLPAEHLFDMHVELQPAQLISTTLGTRLTFVTNGGVIEGPRLRGELLPGGGDWLLVGTDQIGRVDVRATLRTHDGALIHYEARGVIKVPADGLDRLAAGEVLPFDDTYVRTTPTFETADGRYLWLNEIVAVGYNILSPNHIDYRIYRLL